MTYAEWKDGLGNCCADIVQKFAALYSHIDILADLPEMADQDTRDEASALVAIKLLRMHDAIATLANKNVTSASKGASSTHERSESVNQATGE